MSRSIKGITIEIGGDTTPLMKALEGVNGEIKTTEGKLKDINRLLKMDPGNTELLTQKYKTLQQDVQATSEKLSTLKDASRQADQALADGTMSSAEYDTLQREIIDTEQRLKSLTNTYEKFGSVQAQQIAAAGEKMKELGGKMEDVGRGLTTHVTLPLAAVGAAGVASFAEVDKTMALTNKTMKNSAEEAELLNSAMKEAAANSTFGMSDAATATLNFARAGLSAEQAAAALAPAMNLAAGEGGNLDTVSAGLIGTIRSFKGAFDEAGKYADVFAAGCNNSNLEINSLSNSMSIAAPMFATAGYSIEDATLALGLMANQNIDANVAANSLKTGLARLVAPAKAGAEALSDLGFGAGDASESEQKLIKAQHKLEEATAAHHAKQLKYNEAVKKHGEASSQAATAMAALIKAENKQEEAQSAVNLLTQEASEGTSSYGSLMVDAEGNMRPFIEILGTLQGAFAGLSEAEQMEAASAIFGKEQMAPWLALIRSAPEDVTSLNEALRDCTGTTDEMAEAMMSGFGGSLEKLKSSVDVLVTSIGEALAPTIQKVADVIQALVDKFNALTPAQQEMIVKIGLVVAAIGPVLIVVGKIITAVGTIMTIVPKLAGAIKAVQGAIAALNAVMLANPILLVIAGIAALVAAFIYFWNTSEGFRNFWIGLWETIKSVTVTIWEGITGFFTKAWDTIKNTCETVFNGIRDFFTWVWESIRDTIGGILQVIWDRISSVWNGIYDTIAPLLEALRYLFETIFEAIHILIGKAQDAISAKITKVWNGITAFIKPILEGIKSFCVTTWNTISGAVRGAMDAVKSKVTSALNTVKNTFSTIWNGITSFLKPILDGIYQSVSRIFKNIVESVSTKMSGVRTAVKKGFDDAVNHIKGLISQAKNWGRDLVQGMIDGIREKIKGMADAVTGLADGIRAKLHFSVPDEGPLRDYQSWMPDFIRGLASGIERSRWMIQNAMDHVAGDMVLSPAITGAVSSMAAIQNQSRGQADDALVSLLEQYLPYLPQLAKMQVVTDTGALVGQLTAPMDAEFGIRATRNWRERGI